MDRKYFDAKFDGLEKLMNAQNENTTNHINAVSTNVKRVEVALSEHKESNEAHGIASSNKNTSLIISWLGLGIATVLGAFKVLESHR